MYIKVADAARVLKLDIDRNCAKQYSLLCCVNFSTYTDGYFVGMTKMKFKILKHDCHVWGQRCLDGATVTFNDQRSQELYRSSRPPVGLKPEINFLKDPNNQSRLISFTTCCCYFHQDWHQDEVEVWLSDDLFGGSGVGILGVTVRGIGTRGGNMWGRGKSLTQCDKMPRKGSGDF